MGFNGVVVSKFADKLTAEGGFPGADVADNDIQSPFEAQGKFEFLEAAHMLLGMKEVVRIRRVGKGFLI